MSNFNQRISALGGRPMGVQPAFAGGNPNPAGSPLVYTGVAASGVGHNGWAADDWARWRAGT
eukprot:8044862-Alexandrium_andersonii.AAC.1